MGLQLGLALAQLALFGVRLRTIVCVWERSEKKQYCCRYVEGTAN
jgi:hypothetical protein